LTESELILGCIKEDIRCQRHLFNQFAGKMMTVCLRYAHDQMEAEDMLQDAFVRIYGHLHQFKFEGSFEGWIRRIVVNTCLKHLQKRKMQFTEVQADHGSTAPRVDSYVWNNLGQEEILKLVHNLPYGYRLVFNLNVIEGFSHEEIAKMLHIQASTSRSQLVKARKMLMNQILQLQKIAV
jgi:RNA polymerase sigma factor (sigma-70 family)